MPLRFERVAQHRAQRILVLDEEDWKGGGQSAVSAPSRPGHQHGALLPGCRRWPWCAAGFPAFTRSSSTSERCRSAAIRFRCAGSSRETKSVARALMRLCMRLGERPGASERLAFGGDPLLPVGLAALAGRRSGGSRRNRGFSSVGRCRCRIRCGGGLRSAGLDRRGARRRLRPQAAVGVDLARRPDRPAALFLTSRDVTQRLGRERHCPHDAARDQAEHQQLLHTPGFWAAPAARSSCPRAGKVIRSYRPQAGRRPWPPTSHSSVVQEITRIPR